MTKTTCQDIYVRFGIGNGQHISFRDGPTASQELMVVEDGVRLEILYRNKDHTAIKSIVFPIKDVKEYSCENISNYERT